MIGLLLDTSIVERWYGEAVLAIFGMEDCASIESTLPELDRDIKSAIAEIRNVGKATLDDLKLKRMREAFRAMPDMDPSRYRPASEALIRRSLDKEIFRINPFVDINNLLSIRLRIPLGIYDIDQIEQSIWIYRIGEVNESYTTISNQMKNAGGKLVIADSLGVIGSPVTDSRRAAIRVGSKNIVVIAYLPFKTSKDEAEGLIGLIEATFSKYVHSVKNYRQILMA